MVLARIKIKGLVQGVGFRYYCYQRASELGLNGYAKNLMTGEVEIEAEGSMGMIDEFLKTLKIGPPAAKVSEVNVDFTEFENKYSGFNMY